MVYLAKVVIYYEKKVYLSKINIIIPHLNKIDNQSLGKVEVGRIDSLRILIKKKKERDNFCPGNIS